MGVSDDVFCFAGKFETGIRPVQKRLKRAGARIAGFDDEDTTVVVLGGKAKSKERAARKRGLRMLTLQQLEAELVAAEAPPAKVTTTPVGPASPRSLMLALNAIDPSTGDALGQLLSQARANGVSLDLDPLRDGAASHEPAWLFVWCSDADGCEFFAVVESALDDQRRADLLAVTGLCFANSGDATPEQLGAAIRLLAARTAIGNRSPDDLANELFAGWSDELEGAEDRAGIRGADDLLPHVGWLAECGLRGDTQLQRRFSKVVAVNQAM